jgi:uncharacterized repeat protein (TIGR02543 family)
MRFFSRRKGVVWVGVFVLGQVLSFADLMVRNVTAQQRPGGTDIVDIEYDLIGSASSGTVQIEIHYSMDGGASYTKAIGVDGSFGGVQIGLKRQVQWYTSYDLPSETNNDSMRIKVVALGWGTLLPMVEVPEGSFSRGDNFSDNLTTGYNDEKPVRTVDLDAFWIGETEVTWGQWKDVSAWAVNNGYADLNGIGAGKADDHPVYNINWYDAVKWCNARSQKAGLQPVYRVGGNIYRSDDHEPDIDYTKNGYRLPTEAEWEKAARGGKVNKRFPWGDRISHAQANFDGYVFIYSAMPYVDGTSGNSPDYHPDYDNDPTPYTSPVRRFPSNEYGLYDMAGNVYEWCADWYGEIYYDEDSISNPRGPTSGSSRIYRGGSWGVLGSDCRVAARSEGPPISGGPNIGFRVVRTITSSAPVPINDGYLPESNLFTLNTLRRTLSAATLAGGAVSGLGEFINGTSTSVTATADAGYTFVGWTGSASGTENPLTIVMDADKTIGADFISTVHLNRIEAAARETGFSEGEAAVLATPISYDLLTTEMATNGLRLGGIKISDSSTSKQISFRLERSEDLQNWTLEEQIDRSIDLPENGSLFLRVTAP